MCWLCWWARCWTLQHMDHMEASCVFDDEVGPLHRLEYSKIYVLRVTELGIAMLTVHHFMMFRVCSMKDPGDFFRQSSADVPSVKQWPMYIPPTRDFGCRSQWFLPFNEHPTSDRLSANRKTVANPCNQQLFAAGFILCRMWKLAVTHSILTWS